MPTWMDAFTKYSHYWHSYILYAFCNINISFCYIKGPTQVPDLSDPINHVIKPAWNAWNVQKTLFDSRPTVAWPQPLSRDRSATFFKIFPNRLERPKNVVWQSADGRVTSDHCRVTVQRLFSKKISNCLKRRKNVVWQSADSRVTSDHCRVTVQRLFSKILPIAWYLGKQLFDSRPTVASYPTWMESRTNFVWKSADCHVTVRLLCSRGFFSYGFTYCLADVYLVGIYFRHFASVAKKDKATQKIDTEEVYKFKIWYLLHVLSGCLIFDLNCIFSMSFLCLLHNYANLNGCFHKILSLLTFVYIICIL